MKKKILSEKSGVIALFVAVLVAFSFARKDSRELEQTLDRRFPPPASSITEKAVTLPSPAAPALLR